MRGRPAHLRARDRPAAASRLRAAGGVLLAGLAVVLLLAAVADLVATTVTENRAAAAVSRAVGLDVEVDIGPWPASPRLLTRGELQVDLRTAPQTGPPGGLLQGFEVRLAGAAPAADWSSFTADRARWSVTLDPARAPLDLSRLTGTASSVAIATERGGAVTTLSAAEVVLDRTRDAEGGGGASPSTGVVPAASGRDVTLRLDGNGGRASLTAARAGAALAGDGVGGALPLDVRRARVDLQQLELTTGGSAPTRLRADTAALRARGVPLQTEGTATSSAGARLEEVVGHFPMLAVDHADGARELVFASEGATFSTALDEADLGQLWEGPGTVVLADGAVQLALGPVAIDVDVRPEGRLLLLTPALPPAVEALLGQIGPVVVTPQLPEGLTLTSAEVADGALQLRGGGDRIVVPIG